MKSLQYILACSALLLILIFSSRCTNINVTEVDPTGLSLIIPIADTQFKLLEIANKTDNQAFFEVDDQGKIVLIYKSELVKNTARSLFPPIPGLFDFFIEDTSDAVELPIPEGFIIEKGVFAQSQISFYFKTSYVGQFSIEMKLPSISKDNKIWEEKFV